MIAVPEEIKELYHQDHCYKNIRIHFPNGERADICNDLIVKDSVSFKESLCSQNTLKFGLCEASMFECETVGVGNVKGATIDVSCEIECPSSVTGAEWRVDLQKYVYPIKYGTFVIDSATRQADMIHRKITAYGGSSLLSTNNAILKAKEVAVSSTQKDYQPDILATMLMCTSGDQLIDDVTLEEVGEEDVIEVLGGLAAAAWNVFFRVKMLLIDSSNEDELYYIPDPGYIAPRDRLAKKIIDRGIHVFRPPLGQGGATRWVCRQFLGNTGVYFYPYQILNKNEMPSTGGRSIAMVYIAYGQYHYEEINHVLVPVDDGNFRDPDECHIYKVDKSNYPTFRMSVPRIEGSAYVIDERRQRYLDTGYLYDPSQVDYYKAFQDYTELLGEFFTLGRNNAPRVVNIKQQFGLLPNTNLYPDTDLYPEGVTGGKLLPNDYQKCWYDDEYSKLFGRIDVKYKDTNNVDQKYSYFINGITTDDDENSYLTYDLSQNSVITGWNWTAADIKSICAVIGANLEGVRYMPVDFVGRGLPYVEAGDTFEILTKSNDSITTIVLNRTITGEQTLTDSYKSV